MRCSIKWHPSLDSYQNIVLIEEGAIRCFLDLRELHSRGVRIRSSVNRIAPFSHNVCDQRGAKAPLLLTGQKTARSVLWGSWLYTASAVLSRRRWTKEAAEK
jgi:hypothetical protein